LGGVAKIQVNFAQFLFLREISLNNNMPFTNTPKSVLHVASLLLYAFTFIPGIVSSRQQH
jgi:hypothetical protein